MRGLRCLSIERFVTTLNCHQDNRYNFIDHRKEELRLPTRRVPNFRHTARAKDIG